MAAGAALGTGAAIAVIAGLVLLVGAMAWMMWDMSRCADTYDGCMDSSFGERFLGDVKSVLSGAGRLIGIGSNTSRGSVTRSSVATASTPVSAGVGVTR